MKRNVCSCMLFYTFWLFLSHLWLANSFMGRYEAFTVVNLLVSRTWIRTECEGLCLIWLSYCQTKSDNQQRFTNYHLKLFVSDLLNRDTVSTSVLSETCRPYVGPWHSVLLVIGICVWRAITLLFMTCFKHIFMIRNN